MRGATIWFCIAIVAGSLRAGASTAGSLEEYLGAYENAWQHQYDVVSPQPPMPEESKTMLPEVRDSLRTSDDVRLRFRCARVIGLMYPISNGCTDLLIQSLDDSDAVVRTAAAYALAKFAPDATKIVPSLRSRLSDEDERVREAAALSLGAFGKRSEAAISDLEKKVETDPVGHVQAAALDSIAKIDPSVARRRLLRDLKSSADDVRFAAVMVLKGPIGDGVAADDVVPVLCDIVSSERADLWLRQEALDAIFRRYRQRPETIQAIKAAIYASPGVVSPPVAEREWDRPHLAWKRQYPVGLPVHALVHMRDCQLTPQQVTEILRQGIEKGHPKRASLIATVNQYGIVDANLGNAFVTILQSGPASTQQANYSEAVWEQAQALLGLARSPLPKETIAKTVAPYVAARRREGFQALAACGPAAMPYLPEVEAFFGNEVVWIDAVKAAIQIAGPSLKFVEIISEKLAPRLQSDLGAEQDRKAMELLVLCGQPGIKKLISLTDDEHSTSIRRTAISTLGDAGDAAAAAVPRLIAMSRYGSVVHNEAIDCLARLGSVAVPSLALEVASEDYKRACPALYALARMGNAAEPSYTTVLQTWKDVAGKDSFLGGTDLQHGCERVLTNLNETRAAMESLAESGDQRLARAAKAFLKTPEMRRRGPTTGPATR